MMFLIYFFLEVLITIEVGSILGGLNTFLEIVISFFIGIFILVNFKHSIKAKIMELATMQIDSKEFISSNILSLVGAIFLILPGVLSDTIGILMQFSLFSGVFVAIASSRFSKIKRSNYNNYNNNSGFSNKKFKNDDKEIIDVEIIDTKRD